MEEYQFWLEDDAGADLTPVTYNLASFVECYREVKNNGMYIPVACKTTSDSFVYVLTGPGASRIENLEPWCRYLAMTPLGGLGNRLYAGATALENASYADVREINEERVRRSVSSAAELQGLPAATASHVSPRTIAESIDNFGPWSIYHPMWN